MTPTVTGDRLRSHLHVGSRAAHHLGWSECPYITAACQPLQAQKTLRIRTRGSGRLCYPVVPATCRGAWRGRGTARACTGVALCSRTRRRSGWPEPAFCLAFVAGNGWPAYSHS
jgi:hypothetical protein